jgi:hypothetical protein
MAYSSNQWRGYLMFLYKLYQRCEFSRIMKKSIRPLDFYCQIGSEILAQEYQVYLTSLAL